MIDDFALIQIEFALTLGLSSVYTWLMSDVLKALWREKVRKFKRRRDKRAYAESSGEEEGFALEERYDRFRFGPVGP